MQNIWLTLNLRCSIQFSLFKKQEWEHCNKQEVTNCLDYYQRSAVNALFLVKKKWVCMNGRQIGPLEKVYVYIRLGQSNLNVQSKVYNPQSNWALCLIFPCRHVSYIEYVENKIGGLNSLPIFSKLILEVVNWSLLIYRKGWRFAVVALLTFGGEMVWFMGWRRLDGRGESCGSEELLTKITA